jgi:hypothetical protein
MNRCWSEGDLRAWLDGELRDAAGDAVERHVTACPACAETLQRVRVRAERVGMLMGSLAEPAELAAEPARPVLAMPAPRSTAPIWRWSGMVAALAAGLTVAFVLTPSRVTHPVVVPAPRALVAPAPVRDPHPVALAAPPQAPAARTLPRPVAAKPAQSPNGDYYLALDDEPIDTGVVMRVALEGNQQADVIFDSQGRPRAIRPVKVGER